MHPIRTLFGIVSSVAVLAAAPQHLDGIAAVVGDSIILQSEVSAYILMKNPSRETAPDALEMRMLRKQALSELVDGKILLVRAERDTSIVVTSGEVENEVNSRIDYIRTQNKLTLEQLDTVLQREQGTTLARFRKEVRSQIRGDLLRQKMIQAYSSTGGGIARGDVEAFYKVYRDSLPAAGSSVRFSIIRFDNAAGDSVRERSWAKVLKAHASLLDGGDFAAVAKEMSEDPSAQSGGDLGFVAKGSLGEIRFEEEIFALKPGTFSKPFETRLGFHIVKAEERREQMVHARQIFVSVAPPENGYAVLFARADSLKKACSDSILFAEAARKFSADDVTRGAGGIMPWQALPEVSAEVRGAFDSLAVGAVSRPVRTDRSVFVYRVAARLETRQLTLADDWAEIAGIAERIDAQKRMARMVDRWRKDTYISIRE